jgi:hypothetical protein
VKKEGKLCKMYCPGKPNRGRNWYKSTDLPLISDAEAIMKSHKLSTCGGFKMRCTVCAILLCLD